LKSRKSGSEAKRSENKNIKKFVMQKIGNLKSKVKFPVEIIIRIKRYLRSYKRQFLQNREVKAELSC
jgi:hypothetical protein